MRYDITSQVTGDLLAMNLTDDEVSVWCACHPSALVWVSQA